MQNMIHVNLSLALLLSLILFVSGIETANENRVSIYIMHSLLMNYSNMYCNSMIEVFKYDAISYS